MPADKWRRYNNFPEYKGDGTIDMDNDTFKVALFLSTSNCATLTHTQFSNLNNEHAEQYGYLAGGQALDNVTWTESSGVLTFDSDNEVFTASGGSITCRYAVIYSDTAANDELVAYCLLNNAGGGTDVTATDGNTLTIEMHSSGILTESGGQAAS
jgi:hypothetical protein